MTLKVDYGLKSVEYPFKVAAPSEWFTGSAIEITIWCKERFKPETFYYYNSERAWYFVREKDAAFFALKWL